MSRILDLRERIHEETSKVLVGLEQPLETILVALFSGGHVLLEGVPGLAKTLLARTLARVLGGTFSRIQFTPDLMPSDVVGTSIFDLETRKFHVRNGPVFANVVLADEINRAPAKTQSALLEAMQEAQVTIDGTTHVLPHPFIVLATQNPVEHEGTYPLPEASLDRFFCKVVIDYPDEEVEFRILERHVTGLHAAEAGVEDLQPVLDPSAFDELAAEIAAVRVEEPVQRYLMQLVRATRDAPEVRLGASPRATIVLFTAARTLAALRGRDYAIPDDVQEMVFPTLAHRLVLDPGSELDGITPDVFTQRLIERVPVPR